MIYELVSDLAEVLHVMPQEHSRFRILTLLNEAIRRDVHFINRHPTTLFQCLWNTCWWYDCPDAARHYEYGQISGNPVARPLSRLLEVWRSNKEATGDFPWLRALRPPALRLGGAQQTVLRGNDGELASVAFSPDGTRIVTACASPLHYPQDPLRLWDAESGQELARVGGFLKKVHSVVFSPDGRRIAIGTEDGTARIWDAVIGAELLVLRGHEGRVKSVAFSPNGRRIASASVDQTVRIWDAVIGAELLVLRGHEGWVRSVAFSPDGRRIASAADDETVRLWDAESGAELVTLCGHENWKCVAFSPDGRRIASGASERYSDNGQRLGTGTVVVWDVVRGEEVLRLRHELGVSCIAYSPDGQRLASGSRNTVWVWNVNTGVMLEQFHGHSWGVTSVAYSPDGRFIVSGSSDRTAVVWKTGQRSTMVHLRGHQSQVFSWQIVFSPDGRFIASGSLFTGEVWLWDAASGEAIALLGTHGDAVLSVGWCSDCRRFITESWLTWREWDAENRTCLRVEENTVGARGPKPC